MSRRLRQRIARRRRIKRLRYATYPRWFASTTASACPPTTVARLRALKALIERESP